MFKTGEAGNMHGMFLVLHQQSVLSRGWSEKGRQEQITVDLESCEGVWALS